MSGVDLSGIQPRYVVPATPRPARWLMVAAFVAAVMTLVLHVRAGSYGVVTVVTGVFAVNFGLPLLWSRRAGERVTCVEPERVGTGKTSWRGVLVMSWHRWEQVERVVVPGRWETGGVRLVVDDGSEVLLPGVPREDGERLATAHAQAHGGPGSSPAG